jgi:hypothetical protein
VTAASVRGAAALRVEGVSAGSCHGTGADGKVEDRVLVAWLLAWERGGWRYRLLADAELPWDEVVRVAESVGPVP